jgi:transcriptional regulator with XRE-family HTH domain
MFKNKSPEGKLNIAGGNIRKYRLELKISQRILAERLQLSGIDLGKNAIQQIENGQRFVTDIELKALSEVFCISTDELLR